jgi:hypothetical protein
MDGADRAADEKLLNLIFGSDDQDGWKELSSKKEGKGKMGNPSPPRSRSPTLKSSRFRCVPI